MDTAGDMASILIRNVELLEDKVGSKEFLGNNELQKTLVGTSAVKPICK